VRSWGKEEWLVAGAVGVMIALVVALCWAAVVDRQQQRERCHSLGGVYSCHTTSLNDFDSKGRVISGSSEDCRCLSRTGSGEIPMEDE
jgi:hypothetical protein